MTSADVSTPREAATPTRRADATSFEKDETLNGEPPEGIARFKLNTSVGVDTVAVAVLDDVEVIKDAGDIVLEVVSLPVIELVAVLEKEAVLLPVEVKVSEPEEEDVIVLVADGVFVALTVGVALEESEIVEVIEAEAPFERELVGD